MARRSDICSDFESTMFRYFLKKKYKLTKTFIARIGVHKSVVYAWLSGHRKPTYKNLFKIASALDVDARQLVTPHGRKIIDDWKLILLEFFDEDRQIEITEITETEKGKKITRDKPKLATREAIELTDRLGYFDQTFDEDELEQTAAEKWYDDLTDEVPEAYKNLEQGFQNGSS